MAVECDWEDIIWEIAWEQFKWKLYDKVLRKLGRRAAGALLAALADSPAPGPGDVIAILWLLYSILDAAWDIGALIRELLALRDGWRHIISRELRRRAEIFGKDFLENECACECLKSYIRDIVAAARARPKSRRLRMRREANERFDKCLRECF